MSCTNIKVCLRGGGASFSVEPVFYENLLELGLSLLQVLFRRLGRSLHLVGVARLGLHSLLRYLCFFGNATPTAVSR